MRQLMRHPTWKRQQRRADAADILGSLTLDIRHSDQIAT
jgi:hypothetical protein